MECPYVECVYNDNCGFLDITKKIPKSKDKCSWYTTNPKQRIKIQKQGVKDGDIESSKTDKRRSPAKEIKPD